MAGCCRNVLCILKSRRIRTNILLERIVLSPEAKILETGGPQRDSMSKHNGRWSQGHRLMTEDLPVGAREVARRCSVSRPHE